MAMPLSLSANTKTSSTATGGYAANRGQLSGTNYTNVGTSQVGDVLNALTGSQGNSLIGGFGNWSTPSNQVSASLSTAGISASTSVSWMPMLLIGGIVALSWWGLRK